MDQPVDHRGGDDVVGEGLAPASEGQVRGDQDRALFVAGGDELEEQVRRVLVERDVADLVDLCGCPHSWIYADIATMSRRGPSAPADVGIGVTRLGIVVG